MPARLGVLPLQTSIMEWLNKRAVNFWMLLSLSGPVVIDCRSPQSLQSCSGVVSSYAGK